VRIRREQRAEDERQILAAIDLRAQDLERIIVAAADYAAHLRESSDRYDRMRATAILLSIRGALSCDRTSAAEERRCSRGTHYLSDHMSIPWAQEHKATRRWSLRRYLVGSESESEPLVVHARTWEAHFARLREQAPWLCIGAP
jgi:hypothetical protein